MEIKKIETLVFSKEERTFLSALAGQMEGICSHLSCANFECHECPLNDLTDKADRLAKELKEILAKSK